MLNETLTDAMTVLRMSIKAKKWVVGQFLENFILPKILGTILPLSL